MHHVPWWWRKAQPFNFDTEATMLITGIALSFLGLGFLCRLLFASAVYTLPFFAGVTAGLAALDSSSSPIVAILAGLIAGIGTLIVGQVAFATIRSPLIRAAISLLFAVPAAVVGYHATLGLAHIGQPSTGWQQALAVVGAMIVGGTAWARMTAMAAPIIGRAGGPAGFPPQSATRNGL